MSDLDEEWSPGDDQEPGVAGAPVGDVDTAREDVPELYYDTLPVFVEDFLAPMFGRDLEGSPTLTWCPEWWRHSEAIYRLESLWRTWESLRLEPGLGSSTWLRDHLDHHLPILMSSHGPFKGCKPNRGHQDRDHRLPCTPPPAGLFDDRTSSPIGQPSQQQPG